jgi:hypothetical protein
VHPEQDPLPDPDLDVHPEQDPLPDRTWMCTRSRTRFRDPDLLPDRDPLSDPLADQSRRSDQDPQAALSWVNRSAAAVPVAAIAVPTACMFCVTLPVPRLPTAVCKASSDDCMAVTCGS